MTLGDAIYKSVELLVGAAIVLAILWATLFRGE